MDDLTHTTRTDGVNIILDRIGSAGTREDAERIWSALRNAGHITHDGQRFHMPSVDFASWI